MAALLRNNELTNNNSNTDGLLPLAGSAVTNQENDGVIVAAQTARNQKVSAIRTLIRSENLEDLATKSDEEIKSSKLYQEIKDEKELNFSNLLDSLDLPLSDNAKISLAKMAAMCPNLIKLDFSNNRLGETSIEIAKILSPSESLETVNLSLNNIGKEVTLVAAYLSPLPKLNSVNLSANPLYEYGVDATEIFGESDTLTHLNLSLCFMDGFLVKVSENLVKSKTLTDVNLRFNNGLYAKLEQDNEADVREIYTNHNESIQAKADEIAQERGELAAAMSFLKDIVSENSVGHIDLVVGLVGAGECEEVLNPVTIHI